MHPLRVGIVGFGEIAQYHLRHLIASGATVVGVATHRPTPPGLSRFDSLDRMLPNVDAITIAVPNHLHAPLCLQAIAAGIPALVEKPLCITAADLAALERALPQARRPIHVGYRLRWNPGLRALKARRRPRREIACSYRLGIEQLARGKPWTRRLSESGGAWFVLGVHALDLARWLINASGEPLNGLHASASARDASTDFPLLVSLSGRTPDGLRIRAGADLRGDAPFRLDVVIDGERIELSRGDWARPAPEDDGAAEAEYAGLVGAFVRAARNEGMDGDAAREILETHRELLEAAELALRAS